MGINTTAKPLHLATLAALLYAATALLHGCKSDECATDDDCAAGELCFKGSCQVAGGLASWGAIG